MTIERASVTTDPYGGEIESWAALGQEWAAVYYGRGDERRQAAMEQGSQAATFGMISNTLTRSLTLKDRLQFDGSEWDITSVALDTPKRGELEVTAVRSR